ncbi:MAG: hypothetical protein GC191_07525 [Azospirillum sp.]|nr:hypothetical protein [Azospirillum sp.]
MTPKQGPFADQTGGDAAARPEHRRRPGLPLGRHVIALAVILVLATAVPTAYGLWLVWERIDFSGRSGIWLRTGPADQQNTEVRGNADAAVAALAAALGGGAPPRVARLRRVPDPATGRLASQDFCIAAAVTAPEGPAAGGTAQPLRYLVVGPERRVSSERADPAAVASACDRALAAPGAGVAGYP